ncbi:MAG: NADH-quinone oxidoreductase subunit NuoF [Candidatus Heimdallarchaeota archaeon]|nr:NADH-quinone oxidoreductase subunit NuoF [Candidatus Heimdallarchaeota archaeon]
MEKPSILICEGVGCGGSKPGKKELRESLIDAIENFNLIDEVKIDFTGCHGFCQKGPIVVIEPEGTFYTHVKPRDAKTIVEQHFIKRNPVKRLLYKDEESNKFIQSYFDIPFYKNQERVILRNCGHINPEKIEDYIDKGGYEALRKVLTNLSPIEIIDEITKSGLRGRGGAGFSTGAKWRFCRQSKGNQKYIICNADEGDPGAFMDRSILEADPHSVIEGMIIASYAMGVTKGYIYVRAEYPVAIRRLQIALKSAKEKGFLGQNILGSDHNLEIEIYEGAGAFVCGEETALIASIMGERGNPSPRPPFPTSGVWGKPTSINNVKTFATVPVIINRGSKWYSSIGTEDSKGTVIFALTGKIRNSGLIEVKFGTTLREIIFDIGGGIPNNKKFKGVQTGGPSGGCLPEFLLHLPVDYKNMSQSGSILGSGGMIVLDETDCMVKLAHYFLTFILDESCGKCVPCRVGVKAMHEILERIIDGKGEMEDLSLLRELSDTIKSASLCGLGQTAPNPVLTTMKYYLDEYISHIKDKSCPAKECKSLLKFAVNAEICTGCTICFQNCPTQAIIGKKGEVHSIDHQRCTYCGICEVSCPSGAIIKLDRMIGEKVILI